MLSQYRQAMEQYRQRVFSFAHYSLHIREDAEDVTQEVFVKLWRNWGKIDHDKLNAWLMRVTHNAIIDHVRRRKNSSDRIDGYADVEELTGAGIEEAEIDAGLFRRHLSQAIRSLKDPFRSILVLRDIQGLSYAEIQETLGLSESQVKVYLHRSRRKLRENRALRELFESGVKTGSSAPRREAGAPG